ncbi:MAG: hypothetical protein FJY85_13430 [Deltaproteobacteria bacterium]|nr:hypothetical protein [Chloroflexota bacterium]MBM3300943.1 hypothetical protein [Deltaproteobacteria bacterium]
MPDDDEEDDTSGFTYIGGVLESIQQQNEEIIKCLHSIEELLKSHAPPPAMPPARPPTPPAAAPTSKKGHKLSEMAQILKDKEEHPEES